jgi:hypothetical protein
MHQQNSSAGERELRISAAGCTLIGRVCEHNEDTIALFEPPDKTLALQLGQLYLLADGAGGHAAGEVASREAVETIVTNIGPHDPEGGSGGVEFHLHVDFPSPLDVIVTISVLEDVEDFVTG